MSKVEWKKFGDVCDILDSQRKPVAKGNRSHGVYPYYGANGIQDYVDDYIFDGTYLLLGEDGSVINKDNSPVLHWATGKIWVNNHAHILQENDKALLRYLYYALQCTDVSDIVRGMPPKLNQANMRTILIPIPSLSEQNRIVKILDTFTASIDNLKEQIALRRKQYEYYRDQLLDLEGKKGVEMKSLGKLCEIKGRIGFRGYTREDQVEEGEGVISLSPGNIEDGKMVYNGCTYITWDKYNESPEIMTFNGDILFCKTGSTVGKVAMVDNLPCEATINPQLVVLKSISINSKFLKYSLGTFRIQSIVKRLAGVGSVPNISQEKLGNLEILLPSLSKQQRIVSILDTFELSIQNLEAQLSQREKQYEYYRNKLLTFE